MEGFSLYSNLPKSFDKKEQEILFYEMAKLKEEYEKTGNVDTQKKYFKIREKLITHNLRMCADFAIKYCRKHNRMRDVEDVYGECTIALTKAIDDYDPSRGVSLITIAYKYMNTLIFNLYVHSRNDALNMTADIEILGKDEEEIEDGFFRFLTDNSDIPESFAQKEFVEDILNYIEKIENDRNRTALKMYLGLGYEREYSQCEIAEVLSCKQATISRNINFERQKLKEYIATNYSHSFPDIVKEIQHPQFATDAEKKQYLFDSYFGLNGLEKKSTMVLSQEIGISLACVNSIINKVLNTLSEERKKELQLDQIKHDNKHKVKYNDDLLMSVLNDYYGLENNPMLSTDELLKKYQLKSINSLYTILRIAKKKFKTEEIDELNQKRKAYRDKKALDRWALCYYMNKGLKGFEKTSQFVIGNQLGISGEAVSLSIKNYQEYLDSLTPEERERVLSEDLIPEQEIM